MNFDLLKTLCGIPATSGDEGAMRDFLFRYVQEQKGIWKVHPEIYSGDYFQDAIILVFGTPKTAVFAHTDTVGYAVAYDKDLVKIGGPRAEKGTALMGTDSQGEVTCKLRVRKGKTEGTPTLHYKAARHIERGTTLTYMPYWRETKNYVQCCYLDNRLGVFNALQLCSNLENGAVVFSTYEEHGGGMAQYAGRFLQEKYNIRLALICDVSLTSKGIKHGRGPVISMRDRGIPRQSYLKKIIALADSGAIPYQLEVESAGGSDGNQLQASSMLWDWCFIGPAEANYHTPDEKVHKQDIANTIALYQLLLEELA